MGRKTNLETRTRNGKASDLAFYWLIVEREDVSRALPLCSERRRETLPVFSSEEDAGAFLEFSRDVAGGLVPRRVAAKELVTLLSGLLRGIGRVALDPTPEMEADVMLELVSVDRERFVETLVSKGATSEARTPTDASNRWNRWNLPIGVLLGAHRGGPLAEGERDGSVVTCPWHGSQFDLCSGEVLHGPAREPQARFEARMREGQVEVRSS